MVCERYEHYLNGKQINDINVVFPTENEAETL
jgi:hypothetical protein